MQDSDIPAKFALVWAEAASGTYKTTPIPTPTQTGSNVARASLQSGFPPPTFVDPAAGGAWPDGRDFNGVLNMLAGTAQWTQAGGPWFYDATFQTDIGGYQAGAVVSSVANAGRLWLSTVDNNMTDPDAAGAGWVIAGSHVTSYIVAPGAGTITVPAFCNEVWVELWGGGGGGSGGLGGSGGAGEYAGGWFTVSPGQVLAYVVGGFGGGGASAGPAGNGGNSSVTGLISAGGGIGGSAGAGQGGSGGTGGSIRMSGGNGQDIDTLGAFQPGQTGMAVGGSSSRGGQGGTINFANAIQFPTVPGGGGGANFNQANGGSGAQGAIFFAFKYGS